MQHRNRIALLAMLIVLVGIFPVAQPATPVTAAPISETEPNDTTKPQSTSVSFNDGFESSSLGSAWSTQTNAAGVVEFSTDYAHNGNQGLFLGQKVGGDALASLIMAVDLTGQTDVFLDFWVRATGDGERRRVFISDNSGASWTQIVDLDNASQNFSHMVVDLSEVATANGLVLNNQFRIRFDYYDYSPGDAGDGMVIDDVRLTQRAQAITNFPLPQEGFEETILPQGLYPQSCGNGVAELTTDYSRNGTQSVFLGQKVGGDALASLIMAVDLTGQTDVFLDFWVRATGDGERRRVFISDNSGASWTQIVDLDNASQNFSHMVVDLSEVATANGLVLNNQFRIRFDYYDYSPGDAGDGMVIDDVRLDSRDPSDDSDSPPPPPACTCPVVWLTDLVCQTAVNAMHSIVSSTLQQDAGDLDLDVFYSVRDVILNPTPTGQRYIELYNAHAPEITQLLSQDATLQEQAVAALTSWQPNLAALVDGNGTEVTITDEQMQTMNTFLDNLAAAGSSDLQETIAQEREAVEQLAGQTMEEAEDVVLAADTVKVYLPLIQVAGQ